MLGLASSMTEWWNRVAAEHRAIKACKRAGGHRWVTADAMIGWRCGDCPARTDGWPEDGPGPTRS